MPQKAPTTVTHKEVMKIFGITPGAAQKRMARYRKKYKKSKAAPVLLIEFCRNIDMHLSDVKEILNS